MLEFRISKYDPKLRDANGAYLHDTWNSYSDIGKVFAGSTLTIRHYQEVEDAYVQTALAFLRESQSAALTVKDLEYANADPRVSEGSMLSGSQIAHAIAEVLREE